MKDEDNTNLHYSIQLHRDYHAVIQNQYFDFKRLCEDDPSVVITQDDQEHWNYSLFVNSVPVEGRFPPLGSLLGSFSLLLALLLSVEGPRCLGSHSFAENHNVSGGVESYLEPSRLFNLLTPSLHKPH